MRRATAAVILALVAALGAAGPAAAGEPDATAPAYDVALRGSDHGFRWTGRETITLTNPGAAPLDQVWIRLWGNGPSGCRGRRAVRIADVAGAVAGRSRGARAPRCRSGSPLRWRPARAAAWRSTSRSACPPCHDRFGHGRRVALLSNAIPALAHLEGGSVAARPLLRERGDVDLPGRRVDGAARRAARDRGRRAGRAAA